MGDNAFRILPTQYIRIEDPDKPIYRIFPLWFLEETLRLRQFALVSPHLWEDPFEVIERNIAVQWPNGDQPQQVFMDQFLPPAYAQCWSMSAESDTLLRAYSRVVKDPKFNRNVCPRDEGVQVKSTPRRLIEALVAGVSLQSKENCFIGSVQYFGQDAWREEIGKIGNAVKDSGLNFFKNPVKRAKLRLMKREAFAHEAEVRLIAIHHKANSSDTIFRVQFDPNAVFDEITFDPRLEIFERKEREKLIRNLGFTGPFRESRLYQGIIYQIFLDKPPGPPRRN